MTRRGTLCLSVVCLLIGTSAGWSEPQGAAAVSPGGTRQLRRIAQSCPSFSWGRVEGAARYELVVYELTGEAPDEGAEPRTPVLHTRVRGTALSWTPSVERCLEPGGRYVWYVRAGDESGEGEWSSGRYFEVEAMPSIQEVAGALKVLRRYVAQYPGVAAELGAGEWMASAESVDGDVGAAPEAAPEDGAALAVTAALVSVPDKTAVRGAVADTTGVTFGLHGISSSTDSGSAGVVGESTASSGASFGVVGEVDSASGVAGAFDNTAGGKVLSGLNNGVEVFGVDGAGDVTVSGLVDGVDVGAHAADANAHHAPSTTLPPSGPAGGDLSGSFPAPDVVDDSHLHTGATVPDLWVDEAGDTMSGTLTLTPLAGNALVANADINLASGNVLKNGNLFIHDNGTDNTAIGTEALINNTTGSANTASGSQALYSNTTGGLNTASGYRALFSNTTGPRNTASGDRALYSNTGGSSNTASGSRALFSNTTGYRNTASGYLALYDNTTGHRNTADGSGALGSNTTGSYNTASGYQALTSNSIGSRNTANGRRALRNSTTGSQNTASGDGALYSNTTGYRNTAVGVNAGTNATTGNDNIFLGSGAIGVSGDANTLRIGGTVGTGSGQQNRAFINGIRGVTSGVADAVSVMIDSAGQLGTVSSSRRFKKDIESMAEASSKLLELRPVTFRYKQVPVEGEQPRQFGLIAEEVAEVFPELVVYDEEGRPETVRYHLLSSMLLNELQKLHGHLAQERRELERLKERLAHLEPPVSSPAGTRTAGLVLARPPKRSGSP